MEDPRERLRLARAALVDRMPYLAGAAFQIRFFPSREVPLMGVDDGLRIFYHPEGVAGLSLYQLAAVLFHELLHWLREHTGERGKALKGDLAGKLGEEEAQRVLNLAYDLEVNDDVGEAFPRHRLPVVEPRGLSLPEGRPGEEYAAWLLRRGVDLQVQDPGSLGLVLPGTGEEEAKGVPKPLPRGLREAVRQAVARELLEAAQGRGDIPQGLLRWAREKLQPKVSWKALLRREVRQGLTSLRAQRFPTWSRAHRRSEGLKPFLLPGKRGVAPRVACVVDTSDSMDEGLLSQALAEVAGLLRAGARVTVYSTDAEVHAVQRVFRPQEVVLLGGGGTDMGAGIARALEDGHRLIVVLTDGLTPWPKAPVRARVVACLLGGEADDPPAWIRTVRVD